MRQRTPVSSSDSSSGSDRYGATGSNGSLPNAPCGWPRFLFGIFVFFLTICSIVALCVRVFYLGHASLAPPHPGTKTYVEVCTSLSEDASSAYVCGFRMEKFPLGGATKFGVIGDTLRTKYRKSSFSDMASLKPAVIDEVLHGLVAALSVSIEMYKDQCEPRRSACERPVLYFTEYPFSHLLFCVIASTIVLIILFGSAIAACCGGLTRLKDLFNMWYAPESRSGANAV